MGTIAFMNAADLTAYAFKPVLNGRSAVQYALDFAKNLPGVSGIVILGDKTLLEREPEFANHTVLSPPGAEWTFQDVLDLMLSQSGTAEHIFYFYGDCPLLDPALAEHLYDTHTKYFADYTFADGYPYGIAPEILKTDMLQAVRRLAGDDPLKVERGTFFSVIQRDINAFDIETELSPRDVRVLRISLTCDTRRNFLQVENVFRTADSPSPSAGELLETVEKHPEGLRTLPSYINFQISGRCPQACAYCPYPLIREDLLDTQEEMALDSFTGMIEKIADFTGDAVIGIGYLGEPACNSRVGEMVKAVLERSDLRLVIETSGVGWSETALETIFAAAKSLPGGLERTTWIVSLDAWSEEVYRSHRGEGYSEAVGFVEKIREIFAETVYVQAVRMTSNETDLEDFYRKWNKDLGNVIIQKYDRFCETLPQRMVTDLSPVKRFPCWHIKRDVVVRLDGTVPQCKEDVRCERVLGNLETDPIEAIWRKGEEIYGEHLREEYSTMCEKCDEYYTYNF